MAFLIRAFLRTLCAMAVCTIYVLPSTVRLAADVGHTIDHVIEDGNRRNGRSAPAATVHTHDGSTHGHRVAVGQLLETADQSEEDDRAASLFVTLGNHLPIGGPELTFGRAADALPRPEPGSPAGSEPILPPLRPPRA